MAVKGDLLAARVRDIRDYFRPQSALGSVTADLLSMWAERIKDADEDVTEAMLFKEMDELIAHLKTAKKRLRNW